MEWITNSLGRAIPAEIEGRKLSPFAGAFAASTGIPGAKGAGADLKPLPARGLFFCAYRRRRK